MSHHNLASNARAKGLQTYCMLLFVCIAGTNLQAQDRCAEAPVDVTSASPEQRPLVCSAAKEALHVLGRCDISVRRPLQVEIMSEVRHPFGGSIFGLFDIRQDKVLVTQEANIPSLVKDTPYASFPSGISTGV